MYLLFRYHDVFPADYYRRGYGEKKVLHAFLVREMDEKKEEADALERS